MSLFITVASNENVLETAQIMQFPTQKTNLILTLNFGKTSRRNEKHRLGQDRKCDGEGRVGSMCR